MSHRYQFLETLGDGTYGTVIKARHIENGSVFAVKMLKERYYSWWETINLREVASLKTLMNHPHIVQAHEVIREEPGRLYFVMEYMNDGNLYELIRRCTRQRQEGLRMTPVLLSDRRIRSIVYQILSGLAYMHSQGYFHRDIKPENILLRGDTCKVADFGLAREIESNPPYTDYVSTRWYRSPELLLRAPRYTLSVDSFAVGCIIPELYSLRPLFPGANEIDQLTKIFSVLGVPSRNNWAGGQNLLNRCRLIFPPLVPYEYRHQYDGRLDVLIHTPLDKYMATAPVEAMHLTAALLVMDPAQRLDAADAIRNDYFRETIHQMEMVKRRGDGALLERQSQYEQHQRGQHGYRSDPWTRPQDAYDIRHAKENHCGQNIGVEMEMSLTKISAIDHCRGAPAMPASIAAKTTSGFHAWKNGNSGAYHQRM